jgi:hypothetical protein
MRWGVTLFDNCDEQRKLIRCGIGLSISLAGMRFGFRKLGYVAWQGQSCDAVEQGTKGMLGYAADTGKTAKTRRNSSPAIWAGQHVRRTRCESLPHRHEIMNSHVGSSVLVRRP